MANNKEINLVIKARDEAKKTLTGVAAAVRELTGEQEDLSKSASKVDSVLAKLGTEFKGLSDSIKSLSEFSKVGQQLEKAAVSLEKFEGAVRASKDSGRNAVNEYGKMSVAVRKLQQDADAASAALSKNENSLKGYIKELQSVQNALRGGRGAEIGLVRADVKAKLAEATTELKRLQTASREANAALEAGQRQQSVLRDRAVASTAALNSQKQALAGFKSELAGTVSSLNQYVAKMGQAATNTSAFVTSFNAAASTPFRLASPLATFAQSAQQARGALTSLGSGFSAFGTGGAQALSLTQRLRSEVLGLTASYVGLYAALDQISQVIEAFRVFEAAQSRLGVAFDGDLAKVSDEITFLRSEAIRLGISFEVLGDTYSKFAIAGKAANFTAAATRDIFTQVAEAAVVNRVNVNDLRGVFKALEQIVSKGKVQAEELRGQLGDRMAGAFSLFAEGLGKTTAELDALLKQGGVFATETTLLQFADNLTKKFGSQLPASLSSLNVQILRFQALITDTQLKIAQGGFAEELRLGINRVNEALQSEAGDQFARSVSNILANLSKGIVFVIENFDLLSKAAQLFISLKVAQGLLSMGASAFEAGKRFRDLNASARVAVSGFSGFANSAISANIQATSVAANNLKASLSGVSGASLTARASMAATSAATVALRGAFALTATAARTMWVAIGGFPGAILTAATFIISSVLGSWASGVDKATAAIDDHEKALGKITAAYNGLKVGVTEYGKSLGGITVNQAQNQLDALKKSLQDVREEVNIPYGGLFDSTIDKIFDNDRNALRKLVDEFKSGNINAQQFKEKLDEFAKANPGVFKDLIASFEGIADQATGVEEKVASAEAALRLIQGTATDADKKLLGLAEAAAEVEKSFDMTDALNNFQEGLKGIKEFIPELSAEMKRLADQAKLDEFVKQVKSLGPVTAETLAQIERARQAINVEAFSNQINGASGMDRSIQLLQRLESFRSTPYYDVNAYRAGYGSDTVTLADGSIQKIVQGMTVTQTDALRDLVRRIGDFQNVIKSQIGADRFGAFSAEQQAALTSIAYNYGELPQRIVKAVREGSAEEIAAAVRGLGGDNNGINRGRRNQEAAILEAGSAGLSLQAAEAERKKAEEAQKYLDTLTQQNAEKRFEISNLQETARQQAINTALFQAENQAKAAGVTLTQQQKTEIATLAAQQFDIQNKDRIAAEQKQAVEKQVNDLLEQRRLLLEQIEFYRDKGDTGTVGQLESQVVVVNDRLKEAIQSALSFWQTVGGAEADNAILKLQNTALTIQNVGQKAIVTGAQIDDMLAQGATNAFDRFAQSIANGENAVDSFKNAFLQFAADFLKQIAQMIIQQAILNALGAGGAGGSSVGGGIAGFIGGLFRHQGGMVGRGYATKPVNPAWFANAVRYHSGGIAGLKPNEVPAILEQGEEVLTRNDPRHMLNGGGSAAQNIKVVNTIDAGSFVSEGLNSTVGEKAILNFIRSNSSSVRSAIGV